MVRSGISFSEFSEMAKRTYVEVCYKDFAIPGRRRTVSRVSVLSGLSRKEVVKMSNYADEDEYVNDVGRSINRATRVVGGWLQDKTYLNKNDKPKTLSIVDDEPSFKSLVQSYSGDVTYGAILDELLHIGAVEIVDGSKVKLLGLGYIPTKGEEEKLTIMGTSTSDLLSTVDHNINNPDEPYFQREVLYRDISQAGINEFRIVSREKCTNLLVDLNEWLANKRAIEEELGLLEKDSRVGVGLYFIKSSPSEGENNDETKNQ